MRTGDDEHRDRAFDRLVDVAGQRPPDEREDARTEGHLEQQRGGAIGERLGPRTGGLRLGHEPLDAGERGVVAHRPDPDPHRGIGGDGPRHDPVARAPVDRRDSPVIIDSSNAAAPSSIDPSAGTRPPGAPRRGRPGPEFARRGPRCTTAPSTVRPRRATGRRGRRGRWRPDPNAFISCQCPSSITSISSTSSHQNSRSSHASLGGEAGHERHRDRERDQQHHARLPIAESHHATRAGTASRRRRTPPFPNSERDPLRPRARRGREAEQVLQHRRPDQHRHGEQEAQPEPVAEHRDAVARVLIVAARLGADVVLLVHRDQSSADEPERLARARCGQASFAVRQPTALMISSDSWVNCCRWATRSVLRRSTMAS